MAADQGAAFEPCQACRATGEWSDGHRCSSCGGSGEVPAAASGLRLPRCVWCGRPISGLRFKTCREHYDLEQALRLYYNGGHTHGR